MTSHDGGRQRMLLRAQKRSSPPRATHRAHPKTKRFHIQSSVLGHPDSDWLTLELIRPDLGPLWGPFGAPEALWRPFGDPLGPRPRPWAVLRLNFAGNLGQRCIKLNAIFTELQSSNASPFGSARSHSRGSIRLHKVCKSVFRNCKSCEKSCLRFIITQWEYSSISIENLNAP